MTLEILVLGLGLLGGFVAGLLGIGGGIVLAPALLYLPAALGAGPLDMRQVAGLTITQALFACLAGWHRHHRHRRVNRRLVAWMGGSILVSAGAGAMASRWLANQLLTMVFAGLAVVAAGLMWLPAEDGDEAQEADACGFNAPLAVLVAGTVGLLGGMVGQGGSFLLVPLMLHVLRLPTRVAVGSNLPLVFLSSLAGFAGKLATGQILLVPAALLVAGTIPGAQVGAVVSQHTRPRWLRRLLAAVIAAAALRMTVGVALRG